MWEKVNSPIVVAVVVVIAVLGIQSMKKPRLASEIRGVYDELTAIIEDGASDAEKSKAIQKLATEISGQLRTGFSAGMTSGEAENDKDKIFLESRSKISISEFKFVPSKWAGGQDYIYRLTNNSDQHIQQIKLNHEFMKNGELENVENKWISEIQILPPGESIALRGEYKYPNGTDPEDFEKFTIDSVSIIVTGFQIKNIM